MRKCLMLAGFCLLGAASADAQSQSQTSLGGELHADAILRQEWTRDIFVAPDDSVDQSRRLVNFRPRFEVTARSFSFGLGADLNLGSDHNFDEDAAPPTLLRDNYNSRNFRLDLAYASLNPSQNIKLEAGRFVMPVPLTEMTWDKDLRPQGAALSIRALDAGGNTKFGLTVLGAKGSHVFDDNDVDMLVASATLGVQSGAQSRFELSGSYIRFSNASSLPVFLLRQNSRAPDGPGLATRYHVVDIVGRLQSSGSLHAQLTADYCINLEADEERKKGLWLAAAIGSVQTSPLRAEYTFAQVDRDATLAAYAGDDFFWQTGWEGHRIDVGTRIAAKASLHGVAQKIRFKDSFVAVEQDRWVKRFRVELRYNY